MIRLDSTLRKLEVLLGGAVAATQPAFVACWSDAGSAGYVGGTTPGTTNGAAPVTLVAAPASGIVRDVDYVSIINRDSASVTVTIRYNDNSTTYNIITVLLEVGAHLVYTHAHGWEVLDSTGALKAGIVGASGASGATGAAISFVSEEWEEYAPNFGGGVGPRKGVDLGYGIQDQSTATTITIDSSGRTLIGDTTARTLATVIPNFQVSGTGSSGSSSIVRYSTPGGGGALFVGGASRGTPGSFSAVQTNDGLLSIVCTGDDGTSFVNNVGLIRFLVDGSVSTGVVPSRLIVQTTNSSGTNVEAIRIDSTQNFITELGEAKQGYDYQTPATGFSITIGNQTSSLLLDPAGTLATGTITMPAAPINGQVVNINSTQTITALTVAANAGQSIKNAPTTLVISTTGSQGYSYIYRTANTTWYRLQ